MPNTNFDTFKQNARTRFTAIWIATNMRCLPPCRMASELTNDKG